MCNNGVRDSGCVCLNKNNKWSDYDLLGTDNVKGLYAEIDVDKIIYDETLSKQLKEKDISKNLDKQKNELNLTGLFG